MDLLEESRTKTTLVPIQATRCAHCFVIREGFYSIFQDALDYCVQNGSGTDIFTFPYLNRHNCRIVATSKNLAGQRGNFRSSTGDKNFRQNTLSETFRVKDKR